MSSIAEQIQAERSLVGAPRVTAVPPGYTEAVTLALRHARARLVLPASLPIVWVSRAGGNQGETWTWPDGRVEVVINAGVDMSPRTVAWTVLHECFHVAYPRLSYAESEPQANSFAFQVTERESTDDFLTLDWRRPSGRLR